MEQIHYGRKRRGIIKELNEKIEDWIESIDNELVREIVEKNVIITGGSIASMLLGERINDFDVYFKTKEAAKAVAHYYVTKFKQSNNPKFGNGTPLTMYVDEQVRENIKGEKEERVVIMIKSAGVVSENMSPYEYFEQQPVRELEKFSESLLNENADDKGEKYRVLFMSDNAITLSHKIQIIVRFFGKPEEIHNNYDFVHAMNYYDYSERNLVLKPEALESLLSRTLVYKGSLYPIASIFRMKKFIERGWRISAGQQLKIMWQISEIDMKDKEILKEQLVGVDMAYLYQVVEALNDKDPELINSAYVSEIIDRIFD